MSIANSEELDKWLFEHAQVLGHTCTGIKASEINVAYKDETTGETIDIIYV